MKLINVMFLLLLVSCSHICKPVDEEKEQRHEYKVAPNRFNDLGSSIFIKHYI